MLHTIGQSIIGTLMTLMLRAQSLACTSLALLCHHAYNTTGSEGKLSCL